MDISAALRARPLPDADAVLLVPPFVHVYRPSLGVHLLQACAAREGMTVAVLYPSILYAAAVGQRAYADLCDAPLYWFVGERLFCRPAYGIDPLSEDHTAFWADVATYGTAVDRWSAEAGAPMGVGFARADLLRWAAAAEGLVAAVAGHLAGRYRLVGSTTTYEQTAPSIALLRAIKARDPTVVTVLGGRNCDGEMAHGIAGLSAAVDHVVSGEGESAFVDLLRAVCAGAPPAERILDGTLVHDLDALPIPSYDAYFQQLDAWLPDLETQVWLNAETSRGCWWGAVHHCTFCGLIGTGMADRTKSPERALHELATLTRRHPVGHVNLTDNILPHSYHRTVIPRLRDALDDVTLFWELKANLDLHRVHALAAAGVRHAQPGIESLSTEVLALMRKGQRARTCIALLRYARIAGIRLTWNLLFGFPGDERRHYEEMLAFLPLLRHLQPPSGLGPLSLQRFSPYYENAAEFGISAVRPRRFYADVLPPGADIDRVAYYFEGRFRSGSLEAPDVMEALSAEVARWRGAWAGGAPPVVFVRAAGPDQYVLVDDRPGSAATVYLDEAMARAALVGGPVERVPHAGWALRAGLAIALDGWCVPLALAPYDLLSRLEATPCPPTTGPVPPAR